MNDRTAQLQARTHDLQETSRSIRRLYEELTARAAGLRRRSDHHLDVLNELAHEVRTPLPGARALPELALDPPSHGEAAGVVREELESSVTSCAFSCGWRLSGAWGRFDLHGRVARAGPSFSSLRLRLFRRRRRASGVSSRGTLRGGKICYAPA
ncbi:MAG: hypothetical protein ACYC91_14585 [Solirubrobacteraceae bacterium]